METRAFDTALRRTRGTLERFPLVLLASLLGMAAALRLNHLPPAPAAPRDLALNAMLACWLGVPLLTALALFAEGRRLGRLVSLLIQAAGVLALYAYWRGLDETPFPIRMVRFWLLMASAHLLVILAPALGQGATESSFWRFNLRLATRAGQGLLHAALLILGASVALAAVKALFAVPLPDAVFLDPVIAVAGAFLTGFLMAGMPSPEPPDVPPAYPRQLKLAAQFILLPFVTAYLLILYAYGLKVLVAWRWPDIRAAWLVLAFCALGVGALFVIQPLEARRRPERARAGGDAPAREPAAADGEAVSAGAGDAAKPEPGKASLAWTLRLAALRRRFAAFPAAFVTLGRGLRGFEGNGFRVFGAYFYPALIPLLLLLLASIGKRVHEYGLTEARYVVLALAVWLAGITFHYLIDRRRDIRILPASLCLICLLAAYGPWDAFEVSRQSQVQRLKTLLEGHGMLVGGKLAKAAGPVPREAKREIGGIAHYLEERGRLGDLTHWLPSLDDSARTHPVVWLGALDNKFAFLQALELPYVPPSPAGGGAGAAFLCRACEAPVKRVTGFDFLFVDFRSEELLEGRELPGHEGEGLAGLRFAFEPDSGRLRFSARDTAVLDLDLASMYHGLRERYPDAYDLNLPEEEMVVESEADRLKVRLRLRSLQGDAGDAARLKAFTADVFVQVKSSKRRR